MWLRETTIVMVDIAISASTIVLVNWITVHFVKGNLGCFTSAAMFVANMLVRSHLGIHIL
jgi:hypothetical protein